MRWRSPRSGAKERSRLGLGESVKQPRVVFPRWGETSLARGGSRKVRAPQDRAPGNPWEAQACGRCSREQTASRFARPARVKGCGKSAPRVLATGPARHSRLEQGQIGGRWRGPRRSRVGRTRQSATAALDEWLLATEPGLSTDSPPLRLARKLRPWRALGIQPWLQAKLTSPARSCEPPAANAVWAGIDEQSRGPREVLRCASARELGPFPAHPASCVCVVRGGGAPVPTRIGDQHRWNVGNMTRASPLSSPLRCA